MDLILEYQGDELRVKEGQWTAVEIRPPPGFKPGDLRTWPKLDGRLEYVGGRLLYIPPCGDDQQDVAVDVVYVLRSWAKRRPGFRVGGNEAGMLLGRGAEAAVWRKSDLGPNTGGFRRVPPILAVEVAGADEDELKLRNEARWYFDHGVQHVWLLFPEPRELLMLTQASELRFGWSDRVPEVSELPGLKPRVSELFAQIGPPKGHRRH